MTKGKWKETMAVYVEETLFFGDLDIENHTEEIPKAFESKKEWPLFVFARITVNQNNERQFLEQTQYAKGIKELEKPQGLRIS